MSNNSYEEAESHTESLDPETVARLNKALTKTCKQIIHAIFLHVKIQQKDLSAALHTTSSSMSNLLSRIDLISPKLLIVEKSGRAKYYSLTPIARAYAEQELKDKEGPKIRSFSSSSYSETLFNEALNSLYVFQSKAGNDWDIALYNCLSNEPDPPSVLTPYFINFINNMKQLKIKNLENSLKKIYEILHDNILRKKIIHYLETSLKEYYHLLPLFEVEKKSQQAALELIDDIFKNRACKNYRPNNSFVMEDKYFLLYDTINQMSNDVKNLEFDKTQIVTYWKEKYCSQSITFFYIAEKFIKS